MDPNTLAIGLFFFGSGFTLGLAALALGLTLFKDETPPTTAASAANAQPGFCLERLVQSQKPEYRRFSYLLISSAGLLCLAGSAWMLYHSL